MLSPNDLFPYQLIGIEWLTNQRFALLADEPGLGKTAQIIKAFEKIGAKSILVICPAVARINWDREIQMWSTSGRKTTVVEKKTQDIDSDIIITSYDLASTLDPSLQFDLVVLDESHFLKSLTTRRTRSVFGTGGVAHRAKRVWAISGTPAPNHYGEMWIILYSFGQTKLGYSQFIERFCTSYRNPKFGLTITGSNTNRAPELRDLIKPIMLRRKKEDVMLELPPITFDHAVVPASPVDVDILSTFVKWVFPFDRKDELQEQLARERHLVHELIHNNGYKLTTMNALQAINSSVATLRRYMGMQKVPAIAEIIKEELRTKAYEKIVIFAIHRDVIEHLRIALCKFGAVTLYGGTPPEKRQIKIDKFMNTKKCRVFIGNIQCCGTAITLTAAHHVVFAEQSWVPSENAQAMMRCHRIGQRKPVSVRFFALADSFDERLMFVLKKKTKDLTQVFDGQWREMYAEDEESDELIVPQPPQG